MPGTAASLLWRVRLTLTLLGALPCYWIAIFPCARFELRRWERLARSIPDPTLRGHALHKLETEHLASEGAAAFALLATVRAYPQVVRLCVAFEVMYDYLDVLAEQPVDDVLANNRHLYEALSSAFMLDAPIHDHYAELPHSDDGGYLQALIVTCRTSLQRLQSHRQVLPGLQRLTARADDAQSLHHAAASIGHRDLERWAKTQLPEGTALHWWEIAAAAGSPLGIFALIASAARPTDARRATLIERAYFPWIAALSWLLESLVDQHEDDLEVTHSYVAHYGSPQLAAERLALIAERAATDARSLPAAGRHTVLLAGMASMYLSSPGAAHSEAHLAADGVRRAMGRPVTALTFVLRMRRGGELRSDA